MKSKLSFIKKKKISENNLAEYPCWWGLPKVFVEDAN